jgi:hypothetical protein
MSRAVRVAAALLLACLGLVLTTTTTASAADCTCKQAGLEKQVARADLIFIGTVDRVEAQGNGFLYDITASRAYQGTPERETQVLSAGGRDACGLGELGVGTGYLFFATGTGTPYAADACGGTGVANPSKVDKVETLLGAGTAVEPPPPPTAQRTLVEDAAPAGFARAAAPGAAAVLIGLLGLLVVRRLARA